MRLNEGFQYRDWISFVSDVFEASRKLSHHAGQWNDLI
jgi:hypothetical protein